MKIYRWFFSILTLAQLVFILAWFLLTRNLDHIVIPGSIIYTGTMLIGYIAFEVENYRSRKQQLLGNLPL